LSTFDLDDFFKDGGADDEPERLQYLPNGQKHWRKTTGKIRIFLHPQANFARRMEMSFPKWSEFTDRETKETKRYLRAYHTWVDPDSEEIHLGQRRKDDGVWRYGRSKPKLDPALSPFLKLRNYLYQEIDAGRIAQNDVVFAWDYTVKSGEARRMEMPAGALASHPGFVRTKETKYLNMTPRAKSVLVVLDLDDVEAGWQIAFETSILTGMPARFNPTIVPKDGLFGKEIVEVMGRCQEADGDADLGNPRLNPYPFELRFDKDAASPMAMYTVRSLRDDVLLNRVKITDKIQATLQELPPAFEHILGPRDDDAQELYDNMKSAAQIELPLDDIFAAWFAEMEMPTSSSDTTMPASDRMICDGEIDGSPCNVLMDPEWAFCPACGYEGDGNTEPPALADLPDLNRLCNVCNNDVSHNADVCPHCGADPKSPL
jgi:hypothetical protein